MRISLNRIQRTFIAVVAALLKLDTITYLEILIHANRDNSIYCYYVMTQVFFPPVSINFESIDMLACFSLTLKLTNIPSILSYNFKSPIKFDSFNLNVNVLTYFSFFNEGDELMDPETSMIYLLDDLAVISITPDSYNAKWTIAPTSQ